ncbi:MAG: nucleotidyltransferase family protein [Burkholderiales bacterium]
MRIIGILLAAGSGSRFGGGKLLAKLPDNTMIGVAAWRNLHAALPDSIAVVRAGDAALKTALCAAGAPVVECADANLGMSHSLVAGIRAARQANAWVIALADMPFIRPGTIAAVAGAIGRGALITMPAFRGARGHPVGFSSALEQELLAVHGDEGARLVVVHHAPQVVSIETDDPGVLRDIDTRADLPGE